MDEKYRTQNLFSDSSKLQIGVCQANQGPVTCAWIKSYLLASRSNKSTLFQETNYTNKRIQKSF